MVVVQKRVQKLALRAAGGGVGPVWYPVPPSPKPDYHL